MWCPPNVFLLVYKPHEFIDSSIYHLQKPTREIGVMFTHQVNAIPTTGAAPCGDRAVTFGLLG